MVPRLLRAVILALVLPVPLAAQEFLDTGTFLLERGGAEAGRVEFAIRPGPGRQGTPGLLLVATARLRGREVQQALELTNDKVPVTFQQTETSSGRVARRVSAQLTGTRFSARIASNDGEMAREFPVRPPLVILGEEECAGFYFVPRADSGEQRHVTVVRALDARAVAGIVESQGADTVTVAGQVLNATRYSLKLADGDERLFWFTPTGDLLRVAVPATGVVATRTDLTRRS
jgi:hypothetical protein